MKDLLRKFVQVLGQGVEKVGRRLEKSPLGKKPINKIKLLQKTSGVVLPPGRLRKVLEAFESREISSSVPSLSGKKVLHLSTNGNKQWNLIRQKAAATLLHLDASPLYSEVEPTSRADLIEIRASVTQIPLREGEFDFLLLLGAGVQRECINDWAKELARVTREGGRVVISVIHPYLEYLLNPNMGFVHGIDQYFMNLRKAGIYVEEIREIKADDSFKALWGSGGTEFDVNPLKGIPIILILRGVRLKKK